MTLSILLAQFTQDAKSHHISIPSHWHQGRTAYGGLSAALAYHAAKLAAPDLPPLLSAQIAFAGPLSGDVVISAEILRRGKNSAFIKAQIAKGDEVGLSCTFVFMSKRESSIEHHGLRPPIFPPIPKEGETRSGPPEFFTSNLDYPEKRLVLGGEEPTLANWHRLKASNDIDPAAELLCIGDALPPSAMAMMKEPGMVSSINWQTNFLTDAPKTKDGWWYLESHTHHAAHGSSSQYMTVWNSEGQPVMTGMQAVALFI